MLTLTLKWDDQSLCYESNKENPKDKGMFSMTVCLFRPFVFFFFLIGLQRKCYSSLCQLRALFTTAKVEGTIIKKKLGWIKKKQPRSNMASPHPCPGAEGRSRFQQGERWVDPSLRIDAVGFLHVLVVVEKGRAASCSSTLQTPFLHMKFKLYSLPTLRALPMLLALTQEGQREQEIPVPWKHSCSLLFRNEPQCLAQYPT